MKKKIKILFFVAFFLCVTAFTTNNNITEKVIATVQTQTKPTYISVKPLDVVANPQQYINKNITFEAEYVSYSSLGLDYKPAMKESTKYIGILIKRDDVTDHVIPLSEMKIFLERKLAEKHTDLEEGDKIKISGIVFSTALGDPWVDAKEISVVSKKSK